MLKNASLVFADLQEIKQKNSFVYIFLAENGTNNENARTPSHTLYTNVNMNKINLSVGEIMSVYNLGKEQAYQIWAVFSLSSFLYLFLYLDERNKAISIAK